MSYEAWRREVANGTMPEYNEDTGRYGNAGPHAGPGLMSCVICGKRYWEDDDRLVRRGADGTVFCEYCDPLKGHSHCPSCGYDAVDCQCDRRQP